MEPRLNMMENELGARFAKRFAAASMVIAQSALPRSTQELVGLRASQINGCGWCTDLHTKEAARAAGGAVRLARAPPGGGPEVSPGPDQAALALWEEGPRLADASHGVSDE